MTTDKKYDFLRMNSELVIDERCVFFVGSLSFPECCDIKISTIRAWLATLNFRMVDFTATSGGTFPMTWKSKVVKI